MEATLRRCVARLLATCLVLFIWLGPRGASAKSQPERPLPDYDGRAGHGKPPSFGDGALWVPRVLLFPAYVVTEYGLRRPLGYAITEAERAKLPAVLYDFFAFGPDHKAGIVPTAFVDFGFAPSIGFYAFWNDAGFAGHDLRLRGSTWGADWLAGAVSERFRLSSTSTFGLTGALTRRPDYAFYGVGPDTREANLSRYGADTAEVRAAIRVQFFGSSSLESSVGYRGRSFYPGNFARNPSLTARAEAGAFRVPDGYAEGYRAPFSRAVLTLDSRKDDAGSESGVRAVLEAEQGTDPSRAHAAGWLRYGASFGGFLDLGNRGRILSWSVAAELSDPLGSRPVPFTELSTLGGSDKMPGFRGGRLYGRSSALTTLRYAWPIWMWLDGSLQAAVGNVFGERFAGASLSESRFSGALGIESRGSRDSVFQLLVGFGTETFNSGAELNSIRVVAGARSGF